MQTPPEYGSPPKKKMSGCVIALIVCGVLALCCCGGIVGSGWWAFNKGKDFAACGQAFNDLQDAMNEYANDHQGHLPKATTWMADLRPYYEKVSEVERKKVGIIPWMPVDGPFHCTTENVQTGIAFNKDLSGKKISDLKDASTTVMLFETQAPQENLAESYKPLDEATSPKIGGDHRGWFKVSVTGTPMSGKMRYRSRGPGQISVEADSSK